MKSKKYILENINIVLIVLWIILKIIAHITYVEPPICPQMVGIVCEQKQNIIYDIVVPISILLFLIVGIISLIILLKKNKDALVRQKIIPIIPSIVLINRLLWILYLIMHS